MNPISSSTLRNRWKKFAALAICGLLLFSVCSVGFAVLFQPQRKMPEQWCLVTALASLPASGEPKHYSLMQVTRDAWEFRDPKPVSIVYLRRHPNTDQVLALSALSPWSSCWLNFNEELNGFSSCCHLHDDYDLLGRRLGANHPAQRAMDRFETMVYEGEVWVRYEYFHPSIGMSSQQRE